MKRVWNHWQRKWVRRPALCLSRAEAGSVNHIFDFLGQVLPDLNRFMDSMHTRIVHCNKLKEQIEEVEELPGKDGYLCYNAWGGVRVAVKFVRDIETCRHTQISKRSSIAGRKINCLSWPSCSFHIAYIQTS